MLRRPLLSRPAMSVCCCAQSTTVSFVHARLGDRAAQTTDRQLELGRNRNVVHCALGDAIGGKRLWLRAASDGRLAPPPRETVVVCCCWAQHGNPHVRAPLRSTTAAGPALQPQAGTGRRASQPPTPATVCHDLICPSAVIPRGITAGRSAVLARTHANNPIDRVRNTRAAFVRVRSSGGHVLHRTAPPKPAKTLHRRSRNRRAGQASRQEGAKGRSTAQHSSIQRGVFASQDAAFPLFRSTSPCHLGSPRYFSPHSRHPITAAAPPGITASEPSVGRLRCPCFDSQQRREGEAASRRRESTPLLCWGTRRRRSLLPAR